MPITRSEEKYFVHFFNPNANGIRRNRFKLHIGIRPKHFDDVTDKIFDLLIKAVESNVFPEFKIWRFDSVIDNNNKACKRYEHFPYVIYLDDNFTLRNSSQVVMLCREIESILQDIPEGKKEYLSNSDLLLTTHLVFRQAILNKDKNYTDTNLVYVGAFSSKSDSCRQDQVEQEGKESVWFNALRLQIPQSKPLFLPFFMHQPSTVQDLLSEQLQEIPSCGT